MKSSKELLLFAIIFLYLAIKTDAQKALLSGRVIDRNLCPIVNAKVMVTQGGLPVDSTFTNENGNYLFPKLGPGNYDVAFYDRKVGSIVLAVPVPLTDQTIINEKLYPDAKLVAGTKAIKIKKVY